MDAAAPAKPPANPWIIAMVVSLATFMEVLDTTITNVSIRHISGSLSASQEEGTWVLTSYLVANGIILPLSGWLAGIMGRKRFFLTCIAGFTAASFACGASTSLFMLILFRLVQGAAGGGLQPIQQSIILDTFPPAKRGAVFAITGITMICAPILGPTLGGIITDNISWRWIFYINVPVGIFAFLMVSRFVEDPPHAKAHPMGRVDFIGLALIAFGLGTMQYVLDKGQQLDWFGSNLIIGATLFSLSCLTMAVMRLLGQKDPVVDLTLLRDRGFATCCVLIFLTGFVLYGGSTLLPLMLQTSFGYDATLAGLVLSPGGLAVLFLMPLIAKAIGRFQARYLVTIGMLLCGTGMWYTAHFTPQTDYSTFVTMRILQVLGLPFLFIPISTLAFANIPKEKSNKASALFALFRNIGGSIGIALVIAVQVRSQQGHQAYLSEHLRPSQPVYQSALAHAERVLGSTHAAMGHLYRELQNQSALLAYIDAFHFMAVMMGLAAITALLLLPRNNPRASGAPAAAH